MEKKSSFPASVPPALVDLNVWWNLDGCPHKSRSRTTSNPSYDSKVVDARVRGILKVKNKGASLSLCGDVAPPAACSHLSSSIWPLEDRWRRHLNLPDSSVSGASNWGTVTMEVGGHEGRDSGTHSGHMEPVASLKASVMSAASLPCHYLSLHALISAPMAPCDTYNDGNAEGRAGANGTCPRVHSGGDSHYNKE
ncbi:hypothetical protein NQZ68_016233 [Dissostichus eleginoides]|nr:hypothetical protein NQZ68_016233 [Dissostichus eleginoides]